MKPKNLILLLFILLASSSFISCEKDEDETSSSKNYLKVGDMEYELYEGHIANEGEGSQYEGFETVLTLYSSSYHQPKQEGRDVFIYFEMYTNTGLKLDNGEYTYNVEKPYPIGSIGEAEYEECTNMMDECNDDIKIASGKITVAENGGVYSITVDCTDEKGNKITGFYKGTLEYLDFQGL